MSDNPAAFGVSASETVGERCAGAVIGTRIGEALDRVELQLPVAGKPVRDVRGQLAHVAAPLQDSVAPVIGEPYGCRLRRPVRGADRPVKHVAQIDSGEVAVPAITERSERSDCADLLEKVCLQGEVVLTGAEPPGVV